MLVVAGLISDHAKPAHAAQKLRARGLAAEAVRTIRDPAAARALAERSAGEGSAALITGGLAGALTGGIAGWVVGASALALGARPTSILAAGGGTALVGLAVGLALGLLMGWLLGRLARRQRLALYEQSVRAGDLLLVAEIAEADLRPTEELLRSYGARGIRAGAAPVAPAA